MSSGRRFSILELDFVLGCIDIGLLQAPLPRMSGFTRIVKATVSRCTLEDSSSFQRCSNLVILTRDIPR